MKRSPGMVYVISIRNQSLVLRCMVLKFKSDVRGTKNDDFFNFGHDEENLILNGEYFFQI